MIVRDEERVLGACLESAKPWVDEMIVVDTGSKDHTVEIAAAAGARVSRCSWCDSFSAARNASIEQATGDWIFWMDADDTLPPDCGRRLRELALTAEDRVFAYILQVHIPPADGEYGLTLVDHVKLFRNRPELRFEGRIHEQILEAINRAGGLIERAPAYVVHSGYDRSAEGQRRKRERDARLLELDLADDPLHPFRWFNKGMTHFHAREFAEAVSALERSLELSQPQESTVRKVYAMLASAYLQLGDVATARTRLEEGLALFPRDPELLFRAGELYRILGDLRAAERSYVRLLNEREAGHIDSLDVTMTGFKAHFNLGAVCQQMGDLGRAEQQWREAVAVEPHFAPGWAALHDLYLGQGRAEEAAAVAARLPAQPGAR